ncbi:hypothetical protein P0R31_37115 [Bradyrhizobium yuanmingense]|uniref:hypothetical protein n=1 Tax=Bradyrhizobium yuanmingense TaxID=108015 RepID=UPI0023BA0353|nr:hypothetical protein [Bradyrhizobium yuanmingense]MDF0522860.1 hypothetical protein [Bradyrhizobium yuanmingense]
MASFVIIFCCPNHRSFILPAVAHQWRVFASHHFLAELAAKSYNYFSVRKREEMANGNRAGDEELSANTWRLAFGYMLLSVVLIAAGGHTFYDFEAFVLWL